MFQRFLERRRDEEGFTLIELMVVVLIIGILIAIALPTFLGARARAQDRAAESSLRNAIAAAKTAYTDADNYDTATDADLPAIEPSLNYVDSGTDSTGPNEISVSGAGQIWIGAAWSQSDTCFYIQDDATSGTTYAKVASSGGTCAAGDAVTYVSAW